MKSFTPFAQSFFLKKASSRKLTGQVAVFGQVLHFLLGFTPFARPFKSILKAVKSKILLKVKPNTNEFLLRLIEL